MKQVKSITGQDLKEMFTTATSWLEKSASDIDSLNVFPVPDGDTGTNMLLTMRSTMEEAEKAADTSISSITKAMATGALMGARGNSGVILSQFWSGLAQGLTGKETVDGHDWADALQKASEAAYKGLSNPVEGTILTVTKEAAAAAREQASENGDVVLVMEAAVSAATESVAPQVEELEHIGHAGVIREFLDSLKNGTKPQTDCTDNIRSIAMVLGAIESAEKGMRVEISV